MNFSATVGGNHQEIARARQRRLAFLSYKKLNSETCVVSKKITKEYDTMIHFANSNRSSVEKTRQNRPEMQEVNKALSGPLEDCELKNCDVNGGYVDALGLKYP